MLILAKEKPIVFNRMMRKLYIKLLLVLLVSFCCGNSVKLYSLYIKKQTVKLLKAEFAFKSTRNSISCF